MFVVNPAELPQQLLGPLVEHLRKNDSDFDDKISPLTVARGRRPSSPDVKPLPGLGPRRHAQPRRAVGCGHLELGAQRRFVHTDRHGDVKVIAFAYERLMRLDLEGQIEIADTAAPLAGVSLAGHANTAAITDSRGNAYCYRLAAHLDAGTGAAPAWGLLQTARAPTRIAALRKHHAAAARADQPGALTTLTAGFGDVESTSTPARLTGITARQRHLPLRSP